MTDRPNTPIAVVGIACRYPDAHTPRQLWENVLARRRAFRRLPDCRLPISEYGDPDRQVPDVTYGTRAAVIDGFEFDWSARRIPRSTFESTDVVHWLALEVALEAVMDAGYDPAAMPGEGAGVIVGNTLTGEQTRSATLRLRWPFVRRCLGTAAAQCGLDTTHTAELERAMQARYKAVFPPVTEDSLAGGLANTIAGRICHYLNLYGGGYIVDGACSSSLLAAATAVERLRQHDLDLVLAGGVDISLDPFELIGFAKTGALSDGDMQVYDRNGRGFIPGEGCGFVVLKRLADARRDGNRVYALLHGWGISSDGRGAGITAPSVAGQVRAIARAFTRTPFRPSRLDFIEGHGTGTVVGDRTELTAIQQVLEADDKMRPRACGITSLKSIIGHTKAASGIGGLIKAVMAVNRRILPPTAGCREPHELFARKAPAIFPVLHGRRYPSEDVLHAGVSSMGFGGINCHVTLTSADAPDPRLAPDLDEDALMASGQETELFVLSADSPAGLSRQAAELARIAAGVSQSELVDLAADLAQRVDPAAPWRAAVVADTAAELETSLEKLAAETGSQSSILGADGHWGKRHTGLRLGMLFPGQGSQQLNMARMLVKRYEWARQMMTAAETQIGTLEARSLQEWIFRDPETARDDHHMQEWSGTLARTHIAQPAICLASALWLRCLAELGLKPVAVGGHSLGELTALYAAGAFDFDTLISVATLRGKIMALDDHDGTMAALACDAESARVLCARIGGAVVPANYNSPQQTVVSGDVHSIDRVLRAAAEQGIQGRHLDVSGAFHSPRMTVAAEKLQREACLPKRMPALRCRLFSTLQGAELTEGLDLRAHLGTQITAAVDFAAMLSRLAQAVDLIAEVGPGRVLSGLVAANLPARSKACLPVESRAGRDRDFNHLLAVLFVKGADPRWPALYERRLVRPFTKPADRNFIVNLCERPVQADQARIRPSGPADETARPDLGVQAGLSAAQWRTYLDRRAGFLARVIRADLDLDSPPVLSPAEPPPVLTPIDKPAQLIPPAGERPVSDLSTRFLALVHQVTGFASESISLQARLLDDLNLDSIKAGDLLVRLAREAGVRWPDHPSVLANASLEEILAAVARLQDRSEVQAAPPEESGVPAPEWVRNFSLQRIPCPLSPHAEVPDGPIARVQIVHAEISAPFAQVLKVGLEALGATVGLAVVEYGCPQETRADDPCTHRIAIMPSGPVPLSALAAQLPFMVALRQILMAAHYEPDAVAAFVQFGGAQFGCSGDTASPAATACSALAASLHLERPDLRVRVIDLPADLNAERAAELCIAEMATDAAFNIAGYDRQLQRWRPQPALSHPATYRPRDICWSAREVILVSGGAKGITAECAEAAADATGAQLALLGSTLWSEENSAPDHEIRHTLARLAAKGIRACYYCCDITRPEAVGPVVQRVRSEQGPIRALIHGAGLNRPRPAATVSADEALAEIGPKVPGLLNLWAALKDDPPGLIVGLSSIIGVSGMPGNAWYGFANETMDSVLRAIAAESPSIQTQAVAFSIWGQTGMGARMGSVTRLSGMGIDAISTAQGRQRFARLFTHDPSVPVVVVTARLGGLDTWRAGDSMVSAGRFCGHIVSCTPGVEAVFKTRLHLAHDLYLKDHQYNGAYLFPTVFGLEAMAQAATAALGQPLQPPLQIEEIHLRRPITVDPGDGAEIVVWAQVEEPGAEGAAPRIRAGVRKSETGLAEDCFSAAFVPATDTVETSAGVDRAVVTLPLVPREDLYRETLLFQGPRFQRIEKIYALKGNSRDRGRAQLAVRRCPDDAALRQAFVDAQGSLLLPDPFFTDALLQSAALLVPQDPCLPVAIERLTLYPANGLDQMCRVHVVLEDCRDQTFLTQVIAVDEQDRPVAQLIGYRLKILKHVSEYPTVDDLCVPAGRDRRLLAEALRAAIEHLAITAPEWELDYIPGIHRLSRQERQWLERPLLENIGERACRQWGCGRDGQVIWQDSGKPALSGPAADLIELTLAHDDRLCLVAGGPRPLGCDLAPVTERSRADWESLLGRYAPLLEELTAQGENLDRAGTRLWAALETARKALGPDPVSLRPGRRHEGAMIFEAVRGRESLPILTLALRLTWGLPKIVALTLSAPPKPPVRLPVEQIDTYAGLCTQPAYEVRPEGPGGESIFVQRFPVTFKPSAQLSRNVYFTHYFDWMGHAREASTFPIMRELIDLLATGRWGSVTNYSRIEIQGETRTGDLVQLRMWTSENGGPCDATMTIQFDFINLMPAGGAQRLAFGELQTTWVELTGPGQARPAPYPKVLQEFFKNMIPKGRAPQPDLSLPMPLDVLRRTDIGQSIYQAASGPIIRPQLGVQSFDTALGQANAVGNVYYAKYYEWQGMLRDRYLQNLLPDYFIGTGERGEAICTACRVDHLREAMPFDRVMVNMGLKAWYRDRALLSFDYYRAEEGRAPIKLAWGSHEMVWVVRDADGRPQPAEFPEPLRRALATAAAREPGRLHRQAIAS
jgi:enediyne polyketide synthase